MIRNVLEIFFAHVVRKYNSGDQEFVKAIDEADKSGEFKKIAKKVNPKMSAVNKILLNEAVWRAVRAKLRIFATIKFPNLEPSLIHGVLSYETIDPDAIDRITISIKADESTKVFFKTLADIFSKKYITFDEKLSNLVNESEN